MELGHEGWPGAHQASRGWRWGGLGVHSNKRKQPHHPLQGGPQTERGGAASGHLSCSQQKPAPGPLPGPGPRSCPHLPSRGPGTPSKGHQMEEGPGAAGTVPQTRGHQATEIPSLLGLHAKVHEPGVRGAGSLGGWEGGSVHGLSQPLVSPGTLGVTQPAPSPPVLALPAIGLRGTLIQGDLTLRPLTNHTCRDLVST